MTNHTPIPPTALAAIRHPGAWKITRLEHADVHAKFDAPEFYEEGPVVAVQHISSDGRRTIHVERNGEALIRTDDDLIEAPSEFRYRFPDGTLPDEDSTTFEWAMNAWFDLYDADSGDHLDCVHFSLQEAIAQAHALLEEKAIQASQI